PNKDTLSKSARNDDSKANTTSKESTHHRLSTGKPAENKKDFDAEAIADKSKTEKCNDNFSLHDIVTADLCQGGVLSSSLADYEERMAQVEMARLVAHSLTEDSPAIIEAATGTGKALDVDTPIPTPSGWKRMGDLIEGDFV